MKSDDIEPAPWASPLARQRGLDVIRARFEERWLLTKEQIRAARALGKSTHKIARELGLSQSAVHKAVRRWKLDTIVERGQEISHPHHTDPRCDNILCYCVHQRWMTSEKRP